MPPSNGTTSKVPSAKPIGSLNSSIAVPLRLFPPTYTGPNATAKLQKELDSHTTRQLSSLLRLPFAKFWSSVLHDSSENAFYSIRRFLDGYFRIDPGTSTSLEGRDPEVAQKVFYLVCRLALAPVELAERKFESEDEQDELSEWVAHRWADEVYDSELLTLPRLLEVVRVFGGTNGATLRGACACVLHAQPRLLADLAASIRVVVGSVHAVQKTYGKASGGNGSKGKGKARTSTADTSISGASPSSSLGDDTSLLHRAISDLRGLLMIGEEAVAAVFLANPDLVAALTDAYQVANILGKPVDDDETVPAPHVDCVVDVEAALSTEGTDALTHSRRLKAAVLMFIETLFHVHFFTPLQLATSPATSIPSATPATSPPSMSDVQSLTEQLCNMSMQLLELSSFDAPVRFFETAPLLVDLEVFASLGGWFSKLIERFDDLKEDARLEYLVQSLEQLVIFSGNAEMKRLMANHRDDKSRRDSVVTTALTSPTGAMNGEPRVATLDSRAVNEDFVKRTLLVSQVQDLFPDLGEGFIEACLLAFDDDAEVVIMKILEDDLPDYVQRLDRQMQRTAPIIEKVLSAVVVRPPTPPPRSVSVEPPTEPESPATILSSRRNIHDGDEFDIFRRGHLNMANVQFGKRSDKANLLDDKSFVQSHREALLATQYDEYDDEYDDTYDTTDVKLSGLAEPPTADATPILSQPQRASTVEVVDPLEAILVVAYQKSPAVYTRAQRKTPARAELKRATTWSDEQIEGWGVMLERNVSLLEIAGMPSAA
ncbi:hypothetical protein HKX48_003856 [Thoreauomyces humboldtii]|nr:hypothetical protein HKX48_003856 [Thoreauomyces humboldtii]